MCNFRKDVRVKVLPIKCWELRIIRKSEPFISCICLYQAPCLVLKTRRVKSGEIRAPGSSTAFQRCFFHLIEFHWVENSETGTWQCSWGRISNWLSRRSIERVGSNWGVKHKRTKSRKNALLQFQKVVSKTGDCDGVLSLLTVDDFSFVNEMRIKLLSSYPNGHFVVQCPEDKNTSVVKNIALMQWKAVEKAI